MDPSILYLLIVGTANLVLIALLLLAIRTFARSFSNIPAVLQGFIDGFLWEESEEVQSDGVKRVVRKPSAQLVALLQTAVPAIAPVLMKEGLEWAKKNVKLGGPAGPGGGMPLGIGKMLGLPKGLGGLVDQFAPGLIQKFLPGLGGMGGAEKPAEAGASTNPFLKQ